MANPKERIRSSGPTPTTNKSRHNGLTGRLAGRNPLPTTGSGTGTSCHYTRWKAYPGHVILSGKAWHTWGDYFSTHSPIPHSQSQPPSPYTSKPCMTTGLRRGPITLGLHRSQNTNTLQRRPRLLEASLAQSSTVPPPTRSSIRAHFYCSVYPRGGHHTVLPMYSSTPQPYLSQRGRHQVVVRIPHRGHVLVCDHVHRNEPTHSIHFLYRQPRNCP